MRNQPMKLEELRKNVLQWSSDRGILEQSTYEKQVQKFYEEKAELVTTPDIEDAYGDMMVCLLNAELLLDQKKPRTLTNEQIHNSKILGAMDYYLVMGFINMAIDLLEDEATLITGDAGICYQKAWDDIKYRVGKMIDGKFVKWANLSAEDRQDVLNSGQIERLPIEEQRKYTDA